MNKVKNTLNKKNFLILALLLCTAIARAQYNQVNDIPYREAAGAMPRSAASSTCIIRPQSRTHPWWYGSTEVASRVARSTSTRNS